MSVDLSLLDELRRLAPEFGISEEFLAPLATYLAEVLRWNASTDLIGPASRETLPRHALESAVGARLLTGPVLDVGSGAGFPGIPLAILGLPVVLLEPRERRAAFLRHVLRALPDLRAQVRMARVESLSRPEFSSATARAVGNLAGLLGGGRFLKEGGRLVIWTTRTAQSRNAPGETFAPVAEIPVPGSRERILAVYEKRSTGNTRP